MQYTVRNIPERLDQRLRDRAKQEGISLNRVLVEALSRGVGPEEPRVYHDLDFIIGTWVEDPAFDEAMRDFEQIDEEMWK
jgi:hypothetical protein